MLNKVILMGRLTADPELRHTSANIPVASFRLAVDREFRSQNGERETDFIDIVAWRRNAEFVSNWFHKGQLVAVTGRLQMRTWQDRDGNNRTSYEVVAEETHFAESRRDSAAGGAPAQGARPAPAPAARGDFSAPAPVLSLLRIPPVSAT